MLHIIDTHMDTQREPSYWHWVAPVIVALLTTGGSVLVFWGASSQRIYSLETEVNGLKQGAATREQVQELKSDMREVKADVKELIKQGSANKR